MPGQKWSQVRRDTDWANAGTTAAVGNAEGLVEVEMADIRSIGAWTAESNLGIEVGAIEVNLPAMAMHHLADGLNPRLKYAVGGGVGDHQGRQAVGMFFRPGRQVSLIDVAVGIAGHGHYPQASHHSTGGVGAMGTGWDQADIALVVATGSMPGTNHQQTGVLTL